MQPAIVVFLQWRFAFLTQRRAFARGAAGQDAVAAMAHVDIAWPQTVRHGRQALGVAAHDAPAARCASSAVVKTKRERIDGRITAVTLRNTKLTCAP